MSKTLARLLNLFYIFLFSPIAIGLAFIVFDIKDINIFNFKTKEIKLLVIVLNSLGIFAIKLLERYFKSLKSDDFGFDKKLSIYKTKMLSGIVIIYLLEVVNIFAYLITGDKIIIIIYFLIALLILVYLPNRKKVEKL